ncbi:MAG: TonB-dependent receptor [Caulobacterales bacterium 32-69-10]|nr:MAG: TonB-dependent receptor [Caulobacterales bacterium 32-69-10]
MNVLVRRHGLLITCAGAVLAWSSPSMAAEPPEASVADPVEAEAIVVTAQGREQRLQDVPISVTTTSGAALEKQTILNLEGLSVRQPSFRISQSPASDYVAIRGVGSSANIGFEQSVGTFVDGLYRGRSRDTRSALFDLDRVEVLKGPQTTFFGNNAIAGAVNITTRKPGRSFAANGSAFYAPGTGEYIAEGGVTLPVNDRLSFRLAARQSGMDGYIKNTLRQDDGPHLDDTIGRLSMAWKPVDGVSVDARIDVGRMRDTGVFDIELLQCPPSAAFGAPSGGCSRYLAANNGVIDDKLDWRSAANPSFYNNDFVEGAWTTKVELGRSTLSFTTGYFHHDYHLLNDPVPIPGAQGGSAVGTSAGLPISLYETYGQFSQEVRFASPADAPVSYIFGAYYQHGQLDVDLYQGFFFAPVAAATGGLLPAATPIAGLIAAKERSDSYSGFAAATWNMTRSLRLNLGARYTQVDKRDERSATIGTSSALPTPATFVPVSAAAQTPLFAAVGVDRGGFATPRRSDNKFLPTASLQYDLAKGAMLYASYSEGFKAGGYSIGTTASTFEPETVKAYEAGVKSTLFDNRLTLNLAGFYSRYRNMQETSTVIAGGVVRQVVANAAQSIVQGVELSATLLVTPGLTLNTNLGYLSSEYADYPNGPCTTLQLAVSARCVQDLSGVARAFAPKYSGNIGLSYRRPVGGRMQATFDANAYFTSRYLVVPTGDYRVAQPGYAKVDLRVGFGPDDGRWEVAVVGKNLTDKLTASYRQIVPGATGALGALPDAPRSIGIQGSFRH